MSTALLVGCSNGDDRGGSVESSPATPSPTASSPSAVPLGRSSLPAGILGDQARWVLDQLQPRSTGPSAGAAEKHFSEEFLAELPAEQVAATFDQVRPAGPFTIVEVAPVTSTGVGARSTTVRLRGQEAIVMEVAVDTQGRIGGLFFRPDPEASPVPRYDSLDGLAADLQGLGTAQVYLGDVDDGDCSTAYQSPDDAAAAPSGSVFKLLVLSAVVDAIAAGDLAWDDELAISEEQKSLPSGRLQDRADGSLVTVREAAGLMISISDNTAADLLLAAAGQDRMTATTDGLELDDPSLSPLLSTRQLFLLGWAAPDLASAWSDAGPRQRRALLARLPDDLGVVDPSDVTSPVWSDGIGWSFTGADICRLHARLQDQATTSAGGPVRRILARNPGVPVPEGVDYLGFKGGSAPGVLALTYYLETDAAGPRVLVVQVRSDTAIDTGAVVSATRGGLTLLAGA